MFQKLGIHELVPAGGTDCRNDENIRKIRDIFCFVNIFYFSIAVRTRTRYNSFQSYAPPIRSREIFTDMGVRTT